MTQTVRSIPRPLVHTNQWFIVISVLATWLTGIEYLLLIPLVAGLLGLVFNFNPIMRGASLFLKKDPSQYIPEDWEQQQFNQWIAVACLSIGFIGFITGFSTVGYVFTAMVAAAAGIALLGFCIGCFIRFQLLQLRAKRASNN